MVVSVRTRVHDAMRAEFSEAVLDLLHERGYENTTVEDLARAAGISRATFFRYFGSKEDAVVRGLTVGDVPDAAAALRALDADLPSEPWPLLRAAFEPQAAAVDARPERIRLRTRVIRATPSLVARLAATRREQIGNLADALDERLEDRLSSRVHAAAGIAVVWECWEEWSEHERSSYRSVLDDAFERLAEGPSGRARDSRLHDDEERAPTTARRGGRPTEER